MNLQLSYSELQKIISKNFQKEISIGSVSTNSICISTMGVKVEMYIVEVKNNDIVVELNFEVDRIVSSEQATRIIIHLNEIEALAKTLDLLSVSEVTLDDSGLSIVADVREQLYHV